MGFAIVLLILACLALTGLLTLMPRPFEVGATVLALACGGLTALLTDGLFLSACAGAFALCALLTLRTTIDTFAALHLARRRSVEPRDARSPQSRRGSEDGPNLAD